jgi:hypothetical protein
MLKKYPFKKIYFCVSYNSLILKQIKILKKCFILLEISYINIMSKTARPGNGGTEEATEEEV